MNELWVLIWVVGFQWCNSDSSKLCRRWAESNEYQIFNSSSSAMEKYDALVELNGKKQIDYLLFKIESEWRIIPKRKNVLYDLKYIERMTK